MILILVVVIGAIIMRTMTLVGIVLMVRAKIRYHNNKCKGAGD